MPDSPLDAPAASPTLVHTPKDLLGPAGRLEALYNPGAPHAPYAVVVCHPHPLFGGTMHNKVVYHAARAFQQAGLPVLRFNFRGAGASQGTHDRGEGEQDDLRAAIAWLTRTTRLPLMVAGFSFGAWVALRACCRRATGTAADPVAATTGTPTERPTVAGTIAGLVALGLPIQVDNRAYTYDFLAGCTLPKLFISGSADAFAPLALLEPTLRAITPPADVLLLPGADHFFQLGAGDSALAPMQHGIHTWLAAWFPAIQAAQPHQPQPQEVPS